MSAPYIILFAIVIVIILIIAYFYNKSSFEGYHMTEVEPMVSNCARSTMMRIFSEFKELLSQYRSSYKKINNELYESLDYMRQSYERLEPTVKNYKAIYRGLKDIDKILTDNVHYDMKTKKTVNNIIDLTEILGSQI